jgi:hypothetical protein
MAGFRAQHGPSWKYVPGIAAALHLSSAEVLEHLWGERPGDLCDCGCSGIKVEPDNPSARTLLVQVLCKGCGKPRTYKQGTPHFALCRPCSQKRVSRFARLGGKGSEHPAAPVIRAALDRAGITLQEAEDRAGYAPGTVSRWLNGRRGKPGVFRETLDRLITVLQAPELSQCQPLRR